MNSSRTPSIRWKEPSHLDLEPLHEPIYQAIPKSSSMKSSVSEKRKRTELRQTRSDAIYAQIGHESTSSKSECPESPSSLELDISLAPNTLKMHQVASISLEDITGAIQTVHVDSRNLLEVRTVQRTWSYDDVALIQASLSAVASPLEDHFEHSPAPILVHSPGHVSVIDNERIARMRKDEIVALWRASERELLHNLGQVRREKCALLEKIAALERQLQVINEKPP